MELINAVMTHDIERVRELLYNGVDPNIRNYDGETALIYASNNGRIDIVESLLRYGADPNIRNSYGETALIKASSCSHAKYFAIDVFFSSRH